MSIGKNTRKPVAAASPMPRTIENATSDMGHTKRLFVLKFNSRRQFDYSGKTIMPGLISATGRHRAESQPSSRTGENSPYGMIGGIEETSASFEARSAPRSYPTFSDLRRRPFIDRF